MPLLGTRGAASARGFGFGATGLAPIPDASLDISQFTYLGYKELNPAFNAIYVDVAGSPNPYCFTMSDDGKYMYINDYGSTYVYQFTLTVPYDITTLTTSGYVRGDIGNFQANGHMGMTWRPDGLRFIIGNYNTGPMSSFTVSTPWMVNTITSSAYGANIPSSVGSYSRTFSRNGLRMLLNPNLNNTTYQYELSSAWDVTTLDPSPTLQTQVQGGTGDRFQAMFSYEGQWFFVIDSSSPRTLKQYASASAFNIPSGGFTNATYQLSMPEISAVDANPRLTEFCFIGGQRYMFIMQQRGDSSLNRQIFAYAKL